MMFKNIVRLKVDSKLKFLQTFLL